VVAVHTHDDQVSVDVVRVLSDHDAAAEPALKSTGTSIRRTLVMTALLPVRGAWLHRYLPCAETASIMPSPSGGPLTRI
jgi:hypothetical protein